MQQKKCKLSFIFDVFLKKKKKFKKNPHHSFIVLYFPLFFSYSNQTKEEIEQDKLEREQRIKAHKLNNESSSSRRKLHADDSDSELGLKHTFYTLYLLLYCYFNIVLFRS